MILKLLISIIAVFVTSYILPGVHIDNFLTVIVAAIVLGLVNTFVKPILVFLTLPATIVTLGLFVFVINALMVLLVDLLIEGFSVDSFVWALLFSLIMSAVTWFLKGLS